MWILARGIKSNWSSEVLWTEIFQRTSRVNKHQQFQNGKRTQRPEVENQNIKGERCAIGFYKKVLEATQGKDPVTYNIARQILQDEVAHEEFLRALSEDLDIMLKK